MEPRRPSTVSRLLARARSLWRGLVRRAELEWEMDEEFRHHIELRREDLIRRGLSPAEAARRARLEFGHVEAYKERARAARGLHVFDRLGLSWLDVKLGVRMLVKYPGLSLVSVAGMSVAIAVGAGGFGFLGALVDGELPLEDGDRVVTLEDMQLEGAVGTGRIALDDLRRWRERLESIQELSAFTGGAEALAVEGGGLAVVSVARMTASGFRVARVAPVLGRVILEEDEREGATPVVVIAQEEWQDRFGGNPDVLGRSVRLGTTVHTVVGVMPEGFGFPVAHRYWVALRTDPRVHGPGEGPDLTVFGRLAEDVTIEQAQAEVTAIATREAAAAGERGGPGPRVLPYTDAFMGIDSPAMAWTIRGFQYVLVLLLVVVCVNVAVLVYARTAARSGEIAVRTALGASRRRVVTQLFAEALVLSLLAALVGLGMAALGFRWLDGRVPGSGAGLPYWVDLGVTPGIVAYAIGLLFLAAAIVGVLPGLRATRRSIRNELQRGWGLRLGRTWTALIVAQVGVAVALVPYAVYIVEPSVRRGLTDADYPVDEFLRVPLSMEGDAPGARTEPYAGETAHVEARFFESAAELLRRLRAEPAVAGATFAREFPGRENIARIEVFGTGTRAATWVNQVDTDLFAVFGVPLLAGRGFSSSDANGTSNAVVVDRVFAEHVLGGGDVLGRRVRLVEAGASEDAEPRPWLEIVGVVPAFTVPPAFQRVAPKLYRPMALADASPGALQLAIRVRRGTAPAAFSGRLREMVASIDPTLRIYDLETALQAERDRQQSLLFVALVALAVTGSIVLLSAAGVYAMMSFTIASRCREIGIRCALGAAPRRVLAAVYRRAGAQLGAGALGGLVVAEAVVRVAGGSFIDAETALVMPATIVIVMTIGLAAALGPARRGLAVQPTEALREE